MIDRLQELDSDELNEIWDVYVADILNMDKVDNENEPPAEENVAPEQLRVYREFIDLD